MMDTRFQNYNSKLWRCCKHFVFFASRALIACANSVVQSLIDFLIEDVCQICKKKRLCPQISGGISLDDDVDERRCQGMALTAPVQIGFSFFKISSHPVCSKCASEFTPARRVGLLGHLFPDGSVLTLRGDIFPGKRYCEALHLAHEQESLVPGRSIEVFAPWMTSDYVLQVVHLLKYKSVTSLVPIISNSISTAIQRFGCRIPADAVLIPVPMHVVEERKRGFDHTMSIAQALSKDLAVPVCTKYLEKIRNTGLQSRTPVERRAQNVRGAFRSANVEGYHVFLVDDLLTTGSTAASCSVALFEGKARSVSVLSFARAF
jgi:ComF family protein